MTTSVTSERPLLTAFRAVEPTFSNLYGRWLSERQYEDFNEYAAVMKRTVEEKGLSFVSASKRPFGCRIKFEGQLYDIRLTTRRIHLVQIHTN